MLLCNVIDSHNLSKRYPNQHYSWVAKITNNREFLLQVGPLYFLYKNSTNFTHPLVGLYKSPLPTARPSWCHRQIESKLPNSTPLLCVHLNRHSNRSQSVTKRDTMIINWSKSPQNRAEMRISGNLSTYDYGKIDVCMFGGKSRAWFWLRLVGLSNYQLNLINITDT